MRTLVALAIIAVVFPVAHARDDAAQPPPGPLGPPPWGSARPVIVNQVVDLLDEAIQLEAGTDLSRWESNVFDTSQFNVVALRASADVEESCLVCFVTWQFGPDDPFGGSTPFIYLLATSSPEPVPIVERPDGVPDLYVRRRLGGPNPEDLSMVRGMYARVVCEASIWWSCANIGIDPELPSTPMGTLTDVKVLLRRY